MRKDRHEGGRSAAAQAQDSRPPCPGGRLKPSATYALADGQTAETCSCSATRNEEPQPQAATTLGLFTLKPAPRRLSS